MRESAHQGTGHYIVQLTPRTGEFMDLWTEISAELISILALISYAGRYYLNTHLHVYCSMHAHVSGGMWWS